MSASPPLGLCAHCAHARRIENRRGSVFLLCELSGRDARFPRFPPLPVLRCAGYTRANAEETPPET